MAQQIISMAKEETSQDILTRVRGLESTNSVIAQSTNAINNAVTSISKKVFGLYYAQGKVSIGSDNVAFELPEDGVERYLVRCYISGKTHIRSTASAKILIDGEEWAKAVSHGDDSSDYQASVGLQSYEFNTTPDYQLTTQYAIGDSVEKYYKDAAMHLYLYGKIPFRSLQLISTSKRGDQSWSCLYYERLK